MKWKKKERAQTVNISSPRLHESDLEWMLLSLFSQSQDMCLCKCAFALQVAIETKSPPVAQLCWNRLEPPLWTQILRASRQQAPLRMEGCCEPARYAALHPTLMISTGMFPISAFFSLFTLPPGRPPLLPLFHLPPPSASHRSVWANLPARARGDRGSIVLGC